MWLHVSRVEVRSQRVGRIRSHWEKEREHRGASNGEVRETVLHRGTIEVNHE
jgi:hypothetical protein